MVAYHRSCAVLDTHSSKIECMAHTCGAGAELAECDSILPVAFPPNDFEWLGFAFLDSYFMVGHSLWDAQSHMKHSSISASSWSSGLNTRWVCHRQSLTWMIFCSLGTGDLNCACYATYGSPPGAWGGIRCPLGGGGDQGTSPHSDLSRHWVSSCSSYHRQQAKLSLKMIFPMNWTQCFHWKKMGPV